MLYCTEKLHEAASKNGSALLEGESYVKNRYLFFDIDGTLAAGGYEYTYVPESAMRALKKLREAGHVLCIATGRSHGMAVEYMDVFGMQTVARTVRAQFPSSAVPLEIWIASLNT